MTATTKKNKDDTCVLRLDMKLTHDMWTMVGLHVRPRYMYRLMQVSKGVKNAVDNETYWAKVAAHWVWRHCDELEFKRIPRGTNANDSTLKLSVMNVDLYNMMGLECGYYAGMEMFLQRVDELIDYHASTLEDGELWMKQWQEIQGMTFRERLLDRLRLNQWLYAGDGPHDTSEWMDMSMKDIAKSYSDMGMNDTPTHQFLCFIEDNPMPIPVKREFMRQMHLLLTGKRVTFDDKPTRADCVAYDVCRY